MTSLQEYMDEAITKVEPNATAEEKAKFKEIIARVVNENAPLGELMGVTPQIKDIIYSQAVRLFKTGQYKQASVAFALLSSLDPENPIYTFGYAATHHMLKNFADAILAYKTAFYLDINNPMALFHIADCYVKLKELQPAIFYFELGKVRAGDDPKFSAIVTNSELIQAKLIEDLKKEIQQGKVE